MNLNKSEIRKQKISDRCSKGLFKD